MIFCQHNHLRVEVDPLTRTYAFYRLSPYVNSNLCLVNDGSSLLLFTKPTQDVMTNYPHPWEWIRDCCIEAIDWHLSLIEMAEQQSHSDISTLIIESLNQEIDELSEVIAIMNQRLEDNYAGCQ